MQNIRVASTSAQVRLEPSRYAADEFAQAAAAQEHDVIVVGAGIFGAPLAYALARSGRKVLLLERDLTVPDRIVGELLQPSGCLSLQKLGLAHTLDGIDSRVVRGYAVYWGSQNVPIPYPDESAPMSWHDDGTSGKGKQSIAGTDGRQEGRSFHHGRFVDALRRAAAAEPNVSLVEGTVNDLVRCTVSGRVLGVSLTPSAKAKLRDGSTPATEPVEIFAPLTIIADGCFSKFRRLLLPADVTPVVRSNFVALQLEDADMPYPGHGHVILRKEDDAVDASDEAGVGPVLVYQLSEHDTRMLIDVPGAKVPSNAHGELREYIRRHVGPALPSSLRPSFDTALANSTDPNKPDCRLRSMPNSWLPAHPQHRLPLLEGCLLAGDALNMRHPLTGGGMTVAMNDVVLLTSILGGGQVVGDIPALAEDDVLDLEEWTGVLSGVEDWFWRRKPLSSTINILAQALHSLFAADDEALDVLKKGCFAYFGRGGECVGGPVGLLSGLRPSPSLLFYHFFSVALYSIWLLFTQPSIPRSGDGKLRVPNPFDYPALLWKSALVFVTAVRVFLPVMSTEIHLI